MALAPYNFPFPCPPISFNCPTLSLAHFCQDPDPSIGTESIAEAWVHIENHLFVDIAEADVDGKFLCEGAQSKDEENAGLSAKKLVCLALNQGSKKKKSKEPPGLPWNPPKRE
jgi:hypothetical protein